MSQLDPTVELVAPPPERVRGRRLHLPGWVMLLLKNPKSCAGLAMVAFVVVIALIAPLISVAHPNDFNLLAARQAPSWHHLFGTTDQGSDIFSQVVIGARRSLLLGAAAAMLATAWSRRPRYHRRIRGWDRRRRRELSHQRLPDHSSNPAADRHLRVPQEPRHGNDDRCPGACPLGIRGSHPARPGAHPQESRLRSGCEGYRRIDDARRVRRARAEHDQQDRRSVRPRLLHRPAR